ncbi:MAG TPA: hypothetical protein VLJ16_11425, partial [Acidobacteriota bacterium]|nr:hypothetical protein [Acidobacteriota bacterium]
FAEWRDGVRVRVERLRAALHVLYKQTLSDADKVLVGEIEKTLETVDLDGSSGVHNHMFVDDDLAKAEKKLKSLDRGKDGGA